MRGATGHELIGVGKGFAELYCETFDVAADREAFLESAEAWRARWQRERSAEWQREQTAKKRRIRELKKDGKSWYAIGLAMGMDGNTARAMVDPAFAERRKRQLSEHRRAKRAAA